MKQRKQVERIARTLDESLAIQLGLLLEGAGAVAFTIGKILRWGIGSSDVATGESNRQALLRDLDDLKAAMRRVEKTLAQRDAYLWDDNERQRDHDHVKQP